MIKQGQSLGLAWVYFMTLAKVQDFQGIHIPLGVGVETFISENGE
jgi:hypothetical protein